MNDEEEKYEDDSLEYKFYIESRWSRFHRENRGYNFMDRSTGLVYNKAQIYNKFIGDENELSLLSDDLSARFARVEKKGWVKGVWMGFSKAKDYEKR